MKALWLSWAARFAALALRERALIAGAAVLGIVLIGYTYGVEPRMRQRAVLVNQATQQEQTLLTLRAQVAQLQVQIAETEKAGKERVSKAQAALTDLDGRLDAARRSLVPPEKVRPLLQDVLAARRNLKLVAMRNLPVAPLLEARAPAQEATKDGKDAAAPTEQHLKVYRHGVEVVVQGNYPDLAEYLVQLERLPQRVYWQKVELGGEYPKMTLAFTVFTLSLSEEWLKL